MKKNIFRIDYKKPFLVLFFILLLTPILCCERFSSMDFRRAHEIMPHTHTFVEARPIHNMNHFYAPQVPSLLLAAMWQMKILPMPAKIWRVFTTDEQNYHALPQEIQKTSSFWYSPPEVNIYSTFGFRINPEHANNIVHISHLTAISITQVLESYNITAKIKWPNDVMVRNKKICGIGIEMECALSEGNPPPSFQVNLNVGLNVNMSSEQCRNVDQPATSMFVEKKTTFSKDNVMDDIARILYTNIQKLYDEGFTSTFLPYLNSHLSYLGRKVKIYHEGMVIEEGIFEGLNESGFAILLREGQKKTVLVGSIQPADEEAASDVPTAHSGNPGDDENPEEEEDPGSEKSKNKKELLDKFDKLYGDNPRKVEIYSQNKVRVNTDLPGGLNKAKELFKELSKRAPNKDLPIDQETLGDLRIQFRPTSKNGHPKIEITNLSKNTLEKITFK